MVNELRRSLCDLYGVGSRRMSRRCPAPRAEQMATRPPSDMVLLLELFWSPAGVLHVVFPPAVLPNAPNAGLGGGSLGCGRAPTTPTTEVMEQSKLLLVCIKTRCGLAAINRPRDCVPRAYLASAPGDIPSLRVPGKQQLLPFPTRAYGYHMRVCTQRRV